MSKNKILFVINSMGCGGAEKSLVSMLSLFDYEKYEVYLQMFNNTGMFLELLPNEVKILPEIDFYKFLRKSPIKQLLAFNPKYLFARLNLFKQLRSNSADDHILHDAQVFWKACRNAISMAENKYDVAIGWGQGNPTHYVAEKVNADKKFAWINADYVSTGHNKDFDLKFYEEFDKIVTVSENLEAIIKRHFKEFEDKIITILDIQNSKLINQMSLFQDKDLNNKDSNIIRIVTVGRIEKLKGYDLAVMSARILKSQDIKFEWYFVGDGALKETIESMVAEFNLEDSIKLVGSKINPYPYIRNADIYVQTSRHEGYCLTLAEARTLNKPCVSTNFDVVYNQIVDGENGLIVEMTPEAVADGIKRLINDDALYYHIQENLKKEKKGNIEEFKKIEKLLEG